MHPESERKVNIHTETERSPEGFFPFFYNTVVAWLFHRGRSRNIRLYRRVSLATVLSKKRTLYKTAILSIARDPGTNFVLLPRAELIIKVAFLMNLKCPYSREVIFSFFLPMMSKLTFSSFTSSKLLGPVNKTSRLNSS